MYRCSQHVCHSPIIAITIRSCCCTSPIRSRTNIRRTGMYGDALQRTALEMHLKLPPPMTAFFYPCGRHQLYMCLLYERNHR